MTDKKKSGSKDHYEVGYGKPPRNNQFKKGQSGNGKGRPQGAKNKVTEEKLHEIINQEAFRKVSISNGNQTLLLPIIKVAVRNLMQQGAKGNLRATRMILRQVDAAQQKLAQEEELKIIMGRYRSDTTES